MKVVYLKNFRKGLATNSSSTHSIIYKNEGDVFKDLNVFKLNYYDRCDRTIAATREAKIKYVFAYVYHEEDLAKLLCNKYPEMKQYFSIIREQDEARKNAKNSWDVEEMFGAHCRGALSNSNIPFSIDYLTEVIENPNIIIVGGSDEEDFVYDTIEGRTEKYMPDDLDCHNKAFKNNPVKNGNYWYGYGNYGPQEDHEDTYKYGKIRFTEKQEEPVPEYPELIDLRITNKCDHGCPFCFMDSKMSEKNADSSFIKGIVNALYGQITEFSIGGGNILLHDELEDILSFIHNKGHKVNITINVKDIDTIINSEKFTNIIRNYVDGIGVSVFNIDDAKKLNEFDNVFNHDYTKPGKYITAHLIPELLGIDMTKQICKEVKVPVLFLGYKTNGRGASQNVKTFTKNDLNDIFENCYCISIDTTFADRYNKWLKENYATYYTLNGCEGEFSMYIDAVNKKGYKSSYELDKPYEMDYSEYWDRRKTDPDFKYYNIKDAFQEIRKDNGFTPYVPKHYWDE